jgi:chromosome segregation ATPase
MSGVVVGRGAPPTWGGQGKTAWGAWAAACRSGDTACGGRIVLLLRDLATDPPWVAPIDARPDTVPDLNPQAGGPEDFLSAVEEAFESLESSGESPAAPRRANDSETQATPTKAELFAVDRDETATPLGSEEFEQIAQLEEMVGRLEQATSVQLGEAITLFEEQLSNERQRREAAETEARRVTERIGRLESDLAQATEALEQHSNQREGIDEMRAQLAALESELNAERQRRRAAESDADVAEERVAGLTRRMEESRMELGQLRQELEQSAEPPMDADLEARLQEQRERFQRQIAVLEQSEAAAQGFASRIEEKFKHFTQQRRLERKQLDGRIGDLESGLDRQFSAKRAWRTAACLSTAFAAFELGMLLLAF